MSGGRWVYKKPGPPIPHKCDPPYVGDNSVTVGSIWLCDCGASYKVTHFNGMRFTRRRKLPLWFKKLPEKK